MVTKKRPAKQPVADLPQVPAPSKPAKKRPAKTVKATGASVVTGDRCSNAPSSVRDAVLAEVQAAGIAGTSRASAALAIADAIDTGEEKGTALASLSRELRMMLDGLARRQADDPVDDLAVKRAARLRKGAEL